jgi:hypothetical protein
MPPVDRPARARRDTEVRRAMSATAVALGRVAGWLGRGRRTRRRAREDGATPVHAREASGEASRQLAREMLAEVRGMIAAYNAGEAGPDRFPSAAAGSADRVAAVWGASTPGGARRPATPASSTGASRASAPSTPPLYSPQFEDRSRTSAGSLSSVSSASATAASGGSALRASDAVTSRARRGRASMDVDVDGHVVMASSPRGSPPATRPHARAARPYYARSRSSAVGVRPLPPLAPADADSSDEESESSAEERRRILSEIVHLLGVRLRDNNVPGGGSGGGGGGGAAHLLRRFPTFAVDKGQVIAGNASCPICLDVLSGTVMLLPCMCSGHETCMTAALSHDRRCPLHRIDVRKHVHEDDLAVAAPPADAEPG